jgi:glycosyltransferase involved in cell wall biosynthesis
MRIGMMADAYKPYISGVTNVIDLSKRYLESQGHEVFVFTFGDENYQDDEKNIIRSPGLAVPESEFHFNIRYNRHTRNLLRSMDIVHVHHPFISGRLAIWYCKPRGIPIVFTNHTRYDLYAKAYIPLLPNGLGERFLKTYFPGFCESVDKVVAPSLGLKNVLIKVGVKSDIEVVPNGVDISPFHKRIEPIDRHEFGFDDEHILLIYIGRLGPEKNLPFLIRAFNGAAQAYDNIRLLIVGDGPERDNLKDLVRLMPIKDRVYFAGFVDYKKIPTYLAAADVFVTASVSEVHPLSVIEAMGAGLPVLGIESPGVADTVKDGVDGYIVKEKDIAAFTAKMIRIASDTELRNQMSRNAKITSENYDYKKTTQQMYELYEHVIQNTTDQRRSIRARWIRFWDQLR